MPDLDLDAIKKRLRPTCDDPDVWALVAEVERLIQEKEYADVMEEVHEARKVRLWNLLERAEAAEQRVKELEQELMTADGYAHTEKQRADAYREVAQKLYDALEYARGEDLIAGWRYDDALATFDALEKEQGWL